MENSRKIWSLMLWPLRYDPAIAWVGSNHSVRSGQFFTHSPQSIWWPWVVTPTSRSLETLQPHQRIYPPLALLTPAHPNSIAQSRVCPRFRQTSCSPPREIHIEITVFWIPTTKKWSCFPFVPSKSQWYPIELPAESHQNPYFSPNQQHIPSNNHDIPQIARFFPLKKYHFESLRIKKQHHIHPCSSISPHDLPQTAR